MTSLAFRLLAAVVGLSGMVAGMSTVSAGGTPPNPPLTLPVQALSGSAGTEPAGKVVYFRVAGVEFKLGGEGDESNALQHLIVYQSQDNEHAPNPGISLSRGQRFLPDPIYSSEDGSLLLVGVKSRKHKQWWVIDTQTVKVIAQLRPEHVVITGAEAAITDPSATLQAAIVRIMPLQAWEKLMWSEDINAVHDASEIAQNWLMQAPNAKFDPAALALARELLDAKKQLIDQRKLVGAWRVRSLQTNTYGAFLYGFFKAEISLRGDLLQLRKSSGSQRRLGLLYPVRDDATTMVFLGASSVNEEPQVGYSRGYSKVDAPERLASDSAGRFFQLRPDRLLLILDAQWSQGFELYELKRP